MSVTYLRLVNECGSATLQWMTNLPSNIVDLHTSNT